MESIKLSKSAKAIMRWQQRKCLLSFSEMLRFLAHEVYESARELQLWSEIDDRQSEQDRKRQAKHIIKLVQKLAGFAAALELVETKGRCDHFSSNLLFSITPIPGGGGGMSRNRVTEAEVRIEIHGIVGAFNNELSQRHFVFIRPDKAGYFENPTPFGDKVDAAFPSARSDLVDAGNCMAGELHTAAVFHLMSAVNAVIIALCRYTGSAIENPEHHDWKPLLDSISARKEAAHKQARGPGRQRDIEFYAGIMADLSALKDIHRNNLSHSRKRYNESEALGVYHRVRDLMERLAPRIAE